MNNFGKQKNINYLINCEMTNQKTRNQDENRVSRKSPIKFSFWVIITSIIVMAICVSITNAVTCPTPLTGKVAVNTEEATAKCIPSIIISR